MKMKVSDYIAEFLANRGIKTIFTVVGGGAMHMNDSFGHHKRLQCIYNHHEQASAIAAEAYARVNNEIAAVCVTSGPGAINALNGVAGAYMDSIPMLVFSGQTKTTLTIRHSGLNLRTLGNQEFDIVSALGGFTKYARMVMDKEKIRYYLEKALYLALHGRPGPCWLDIPVDIQGAYIETEELYGYEGDASLLDLDTDKSIAEKTEILLEHLYKSKRPVLYAGNGISISGARDVFTKLVHKLRIPVATCWDSIDLIETKDQYYVGRAGIMGDRAGNFAIQNSDFILAIGNRLNIYQVGYNLDSWAREAYVVDVDIDREELKKKTIRVDLPICCDAKFIIDFLYGRSDVQKNYAWEPWTKQCVEWKRKYPVVEKRHYEDMSPLNVYAFIDQLSKSLPERAITVVANGSASVVGSQAYVVGHAQRFLMNCALSSMGYDLPAAIGACVANERREIICIAGDGSIQMNIQELQTIITNRLPVKIFIINNNGYQQIRLTQTNIFQANFVGIGPDSGDLGFPNFEKLAYAYGFPYFRCEYLDELSNTIHTVLEHKGYCICEVICTTKQAFEPKSATRKRADGTLISPPLEDMTPFLTRDELKKNMYIPMWGEADD